MRTRGETAGKYDVYVYSPPDVYSPQGHKFRSNNEVSSYLQRHGITDIDPESISFKVEGPTISRFNKLRARHWPDYIDSDGQVAGRSSYSEDLQEEGRSAKSLRGEERAKKDDDVSVLLEDSDDEWIPGMLKN